VLLVTLVGFLIITPSVILSIVVVFGFFIGTGRTEMSVLFVVKFLSGLTTG